MPGGLTQLAVTSEEEDEDAVLRMEDEEVFTVEAVLEKRTKKGQLQYKVKWHGYPESEATWEPLENCVGCEGLISAFEESDKGASPDLAAKALPQKSVRSASKRKAAEPKAAKKEPATTKTKKEKTEKTEGKQAPEKVSKHKYKDADGRLDRKKNGYYELKNTWASSGQAQVAHSGLNTNLDGSLKAMPKKFQKVDAADGTHEPEKILFKRDNKAGQTEYKVKWQDLNSAHATWMAEDVFRAKLGDATAEKLLEAYNKWAQVEEEWIGEPLPDEVAAARWPKRERPGVVNYEAVIVNGTKVCVGDTVRTIADEDFYDDKGGAEDDTANTWVCVVEELWGFASEEYGDMEEKQFAARWFWRAKDTVCKDMAARQPGVAFAMDPRRIFLEKRRDVDVSEDYMNTGMEDSPVSCIYDVVKVERRMPGDSDKEVDDSVDFFYDMSYDEEFCSFEDVNDFTPPPMVHPPVGAYADGSWSPDDSMESDGFLQLLVVFCFQKAMQGNFNLPDCGRNVDEPTDAEVEACLPAGKRGMAVQKKAQITARIAKVLNHYTASALKHSPHKAFVKRTVLAHGWSASKGAFESLPTQDSLRELATALDEPIATRRELLRDGRHYGSPGYGEGVEGASVTAPTTHSRKLRGLDLYAGAGGLSFMDGKRGDASLHTAWAVDIDRMAIETFKTNNPKTSTYVLGTDDFLYLVRRWDELCTELEDVDLSAAEPASKKKKAAGSKQPKQLLDVRPKPLVVAAAKPKATKKRKKSRAEDEDEDEAEEFREMKSEEKLQFLVRWDGSGDDSWVDESELSRHHVAEFVQRWMKTDRIPRPGDVDVLTGGPPCQGVSGYNMCRNGDDPLSDPKNRQMPLFFEIVKFLKPRYVLMENVPDMFKFVGGMYGRFSVSRLIELGYQGRVGFMVAGRYGVPQYRMRCFLWGALSGQPLPGFPMPSHRVMSVAQHVPAELKSNEVKAPPGQKLRREVRLADALTDLPPVKHDDDRDTMPYTGSGPTTEFQKVMRAPPPPGQGVKHEPKLLHNHNPQPLPPDDLYRCEHIPLKKGACWRDLGELSKDGKSTAKPFRWIPLKDKKVPNFPDNNTHADSDKLPPGGGRNPEKCIVPQYCINKAAATTIERPKGHGSEKDRAQGDKSLARLWWDEIFTTCIGRMMIHSHRNMHPGQFRSFSSREYARAQGFPDWYKICGSAKNYCNKRYDNPDSLVPLNKFQQIGNAVSPRLARAMGECLLMCLVHGTPRHAVVKWQPDPEDGDSNTVRDWRPKESQKGTADATAAAAAAADGYGSEEEEMDGDDDAATAPAPKRGGGSKKKAPAKAKAKAKAKKAKKS